ncbi:geraniol 8-hydroxylase-like [Quercus lobata]|uniref:Geraniol 10-hydroxylase n=1 Tax=Quercus lobata TaxID=97700 RepID=A0A7N2N351_QUELO|nr:geraniol 8-hydroxylase-like [Quercus lobata]XP_030946785.1 geraniol 8-hydroxylase-like [Quercus lobata]
MEVLSCILYLCLSLTIIQALHTIAKRSKSIPKKLPPGPKPFPIIGNLLELGDKPHKSLAKLAMTNGPLMSLKLGQITTVVISSATMAKEVLQTHDQLLSNRSIPDAIRAHKQHELGLPWIPVSSRWRNIRKIFNSQLFAHKTLDANQNLRRKKVQELLADVHKSCLTNDAVDIGRAAFKTTLNLLSNTICSVDLADPNSDMAREFKELVWNIMEEVGKPNLADYFPVLRKVDPQGIRRRMTIYFGNMIELFDSLINKRLLTRKEPDSIRNIDMLNTLLDISEESTGEFDKTQIERLFLDLFIAGNDTTSATLEWTMAELIHNPEVLSKAKEELNQIIGKGNQVEESDIARLPYLQAIVKETFRLHPPVPLLLPRKAEADVEIQGFTVPKGAQVLVNAWAIGRDSSIWENPISFKPERFMGSEIDVKGRNFELIPFGGGRRICPGLPLAIRMLHLMLGSLIHTFDWKLEDGFKPEDMSMEDKFGLTLQMAQPLRAIPIMV